MTKHILCAVDLTHENDAKALISEAGRLANLENCSLSVTTVLPDYGSSFVGSFFKAGTLKNASVAANKKLHEFIDEALPNSGPIQCIVEIGTAYEEVLDAAEKCGASLIVIGAHKPNFTNQLLGPNAARVVRNAAISVLVVRL